MCYARGVYIARSDWPQGIAVWWYAGTVSDDEWNATFEHRRELCARSPSLSFRPCVLLVTGSEPLPNALRRRQLCEVQDHPNFNPYIACISSDPRQPGVSTALRWIPNHPNWEERTFPTVERGITWLEAKRGNPLPGLRALANSVRKLVVAQSRSRA